MPSSTPMSTHLGIFGCARHQHRLQTFNGLPIHVMITAFVDGTPRKLSLPFRAYDCYEEPLHEYSTLQRSNSWYEKVLPTSDKRQAAVEAQKACYATDPDYARELISIMA